MSTKAEFDWTKGIYGALVKLIHFISAVQISFAVYYNYNFVNIPLDALPGNVDFGGKFKYLTFLTAVN